MGLLYSNYQANPTTNVKVNAVSGTLVKTFRKSFFKKIDMDSVMAIYVFDETQPRLEKYGDVIVVLQTMLCGDDELLVEMIYKKDYDEIFNIEGGE